MSSDQKHNTAPTRLSRWRVIEANKRATWGEPRLYFCDDADMDEPLVLHVSQGGNGDWYISVLPEGAKIGPTVRLTTSGSPRGFDGVPIAMANLYRALGGELPLSPGTTSVETGGDDVEEVCKGCGEVVVQAHGWSDCVRVLLAEKNRLSSALAERVAEREGVVELFFFVAVIPLHGSAGNSPPQSHASAAPLDVRTLARMLLDGSSRADEPKRLARIVKGLIPPADELARIVRYVARDGDGETPHTEAQKAWASMLEWLMDQGPATLIGATSVQIYAFFYELTKRQIAYNDAWIHEVTALGRAVDAYDAARRLVPESARTPTPNNAPNA
jgi:hypothetical protein